MLECPVARREGLGERALEHLLAIDVGLAGRAELDQLELHVLAGKGLFVVFCDLLCPRGQSESGEENKANDVARLPPSLHDIASPFVNERRPVLEGIVHVLDCATKPLDRPEKGDEKAGGKPKPTDD